MDFQDVEGSCLCVILSESVCLQRVGSRASRVFSVVTLGHPDVKQLTPWRAGKRQVVEQSGPENSERPGRPWNPDAFALGNRCQCTMNAISEN